jgi:hypothetical protein
MLTVLAGLLVSLLGAATASAKSLKPSGHVVAHRVGPSFFTKAEGRGAFKAPPIRHEHPARLAKEKQKAAHEHGKPSPAPAPLSPAAVTLNQDGLLWSSNTTFLYTPPDTTGAIGPDYYFEFVNGVVATYSRSTLASPPLATRQLDAFTGPTGRSVFDPQIQWDQSANRWFYSAISNQGDVANQNFLLFGWSKDANTAGTNLTTNWCRYAINTGSHIDDYDKLGHDATHLIIGSNVFTGNTFNGARVWAIPKPPNGPITNCATHFAIPFFGYNGTAGTGLKTADNDDAFTPVPANTVNPTGGSGYVVAADDPSDHGGSANQIMVWHLSTTPTDPTLVQDGDIGVGAGNDYGVPANVPQPGTTRVLDSQDARLTQAVAQPDPGAGGAEAVWTQHTIAGTGGRSVVRWYELIPSNCTPGTPPTCPASALRQEGNVSSGTQYVFNGAISPTRAGSAAMIDFNEGSSTAYVTVRVQSQTDTSSSAMSNESTLVDSSPNVDQETLTCATVCRWGDYAAASPDPTSDTLVWGSNQYNGLAASGANKKLGWKTRNFAITP